MSDPLELKSDIHRAIELLEALQKSGQIPPEKLAGLQKIFQSEFLDNVREVYEEIHETIEVYGSETARANAVAKATVAAFAAGHGQVHSRVVTLPKTAEGLGFNVMGGQEQNCRLYVSRIIPNGVAERCGGLKRGDQLISVNGQMVEFESHEYAVDLLKKARGIVRLVVRYDPRSLEVVEARFNPSSSAPFTSN